MNIALKVTGMEDVVIHDVKFIPRIGENVLHNRKVLGVEKVLYDLDANVTFVYLA